jgi:hypothetical protein
MTIPNTVQMRVHQIPIKSAWRLALSAQLFNLALVFSSDNLLHLALVGWENLGMPSKQSLSDSACFGTLQELMLLKFPLEYLSSLMTLF